MSTLEAPITPTNPDQLNNLEAYYCDTKNSLQVFEQEASTDETQIETSNQQSGNHAQEKLTEASVEGFLAVDRYEEVKKFCAEYNVSTTQALVAAFHAFLVRCTDGEGRNTYTIYECTQGTFAEGYSLEMCDNLPESFNVLIQNSKSLSHRMRGTKTTPGNCKLLSQELISSSLWNLVVADNVILETIGSPKKGLKLRLTFESEAYETEEMKRSMDNFLGFWSNIIASPHQSLLMVPLCGDKEISIQRHSYWADSASPNSWDNTTIIDIILKIAREYPQNTAIITSDGMTLTYKGLVHRAREIALCLQEAGTSPGDLIGLLCRPGLDEIAGMIAILMNRCGYVAMDPNFAGERLSFMANDAKMRIILVTPDMTTLGTDVAQNSLLSPRLLSFPEPCPTDIHFTPPPTSPQDPFYTIYTSGSTGTPKGVVLTQANTQQMLSTLHHDYEFSRFDRFLHHSSMCFDLSIVEIFAALTCGAAACIASARIKDDPEPLGYFMRQVSITVTYFTPTKFVLLLEACQEYLQQCQEYRVAFFAGERLPARVIERFYNLQLRATIYNTWSPSELVVQTTVHKVPRIIANKTTNIPIGFPLANCAHYIVDSNLNPVPIGVVGEICVGGAQVGRGYINKPYGRCEAFISNPFASEDYTRKGWTMLFKTGDRGRFLRNGELEFHGRIAGDKQIKLRGLRMDLGEIEQRIFEASNCNGLAGLKDVAVTARSIQNRKTKEESMTDDRQLIAFLVLTTGVTDMGQNYVNTVHQLLKAHLNRYMLPNGYQILETLPVTIGGKLDTRNLRNRDLDLLFPSKIGVQEADDGRAEVVDRVVDPTLLTITSLFQTLLALGENYQVAPDDNFFALGGQSMLVLRLQAKLKTTFGMKLPLPSLFKDPTPAAIAQLVQNKNPDVSAFYTTTKNVANHQIDWQLETTLPSQNEFLAPQNFTRLTRSDVTTVLITGADSFIGIHMIATFLSTAHSMKVFFIGSSRAITLANLKISLAKYQLLDDTWSNLPSKLTPINGTLAEPYFGLNEKDFKVLGSALHAIYHIGGEVSLLKSYYDLKPFNISPILTLISLAHYGSYLTEIHYLSTWSVPHLQTWHDTHLAKSAISSSEESTDHFVPSSSPTQGGYLKARWASEVLLTRASERGFRVSIYRASAVTASSATKVPEPMYDLYRYTIIRMIQVRCIPDTQVTSRLPFAVDFIPVNYLTSTLFRLSLSFPAALPMDKHGEKAPTIYHIGNPSPLLLHDLPSLVPQILRQDDIELKADILPLEEWLAAIGTGLAAGEELRIAAIREMFCGGHCSFALDQTRTTATLALLDKAAEENEGSVPGGVNCRVDCSPVGVEYLRAMLENSW